MSLTTATEMARQLVSGTTTAEALTRAALDRIAARDGSVHAFITVDAKGAIAAAVESDLRRKAGHLRGPLDGVPVAIKDNLDVAGLPTTDGTRFWAGRIASDDAEVTARLRAAGTVILGKLNMHEGALGATTDNPFWGRCDNPAAPGHTPGGSSGGSAATVAAGFVPLAIGTDTMGSVRIPAAYCGLWGLKPTPGVVPTRGLCFLSRTLDTIGPIATTPADLRLIFGAMTANDVVQDKLALPGLTLGLPTEADLVEIEPAVRAAFAALCERLPSAGVTLRTVSVPGWEPGRLRRAGLLVSESEAAAEFGSDLDRGGDGFSDEFRALIGYGRNAGPARLAEARARIVAMKGAVTTALSGIDAILMPTAPQRAFPHGAPVPANQADLTALANCAGVPAVAFPIPAPDGGLPASAQLLGLPFSEARLIGLAEVLSSA